MSKDFVVIDVRKPEYKVVKAAFEAWASEGFFVHGTLDNPNDPFKYPEDLKATLFKLGFGDLAREMWDE